MLYFLTIYIIFVMLELAAKNGAKQWRLENINVFFIIRLLMALQSLPPVHLFSPVKNQKIHKNLTNSRNSVS